MSAFDEARKEAESGSVVSQGYVGLGFPRSDLSDGEHHYCTAANPTTRQRPPQSGFVLTGDSDIVDYGREPTMQRGVFRGARTDWGFGDEALAKNETTTGQRFAACCARDLRRSPHFLRQQSW